MCNIKNLFKFIPPNYLEVFVINLIPPHYLEVFVINFIAIAVTIAVIAIISAVMM